MMATHPYPSYWTTFPRIPCHQVCCKRDFTTESHAYQTWEVRESLQTLLPGTSWQKAWHLGFPPSICLRTAGGCDLLQFPGLPGLPNFSSKPEQEWQLPLILAPLALQQFWKHPILWIKSLVFFLSYSTTFPSDSLIIGANLYLPNTVLNILPALPHHTRWLLLLSLSLSLFTLCPSSQRK